MSTKRRAVIYLRVSTQKQAEEGYSLPAQMAACYEYAQRRGWKVVADPYVDAITGATADRAGLDAVRKALKDGEADTLITWVQDRFSRDLADTIMLLNEFEDQGIELHSAKEGKVEYGLIAHIRAAIAADERRRIGERSKMGRLQKAKQGRFPGQGPPPYGFRKVGEGRDVAIEIDPPAADVARRIFDW